MSKVEYIFKSCFLFFHFLVYWLTKSKEIIDKDLFIWRKEFAFSKKRDVNLCYLLIYYPTFRSIFYHRLNQDKRIVIKIIKRFAMFVYPPLSTLCITTNNIGGGLFIQHGYCTIISAKRIGNNCWVNQGVTIGYTNVSDAPIIGNNVKIYAGAKILGNIKIGDNSIIGANAVVVKDVESNTTVGGVPAKVIRKHDSQ